MANGTAFFVVKSKVWGAGAGEGRSRSLRYACGRKGSFVVLPSLSRRVQALLLLPLPAQRFDLQKTCDAGLMVFVQKAGSGGAAERLYATSQRKGAGERVFAHNASMQIHRGLFCGRVRLTPGADSPDFIASIPK
ncbi:hypothetical protein [Aneurinibacillus uraniidurans]|uniref:hypothetical protein n=1 Tax=Aneurinibacillus uraniidurans TaxID=2966586 RepID=UPI002348FB6D|nr:hypothetical protein [Aneurinibacillus sp. B1]WCN39316.1 hypothetical protein PO771_07960 [Aneurinibacillus sp. B1]